MKALLWMGPLLLALLTGHSGRAQQQAQYSQYMNNNFLLNPAVAGTDERIDVRLSHRAQWVGLEGAPASSYLSVHSSLGKSSRSRRRQFHALGGVAYNDVTGPTRRTGLYASYAYNLATNRKTRLALGVSGGFQQFSIDGNQLDFHDPEAVTGFQSSIVPTISVGMWIYGKLNKKNYYLGTSINQLLTSSLNYEYGLVRGSDGRRNQLQRHAYLTGGLLLPLDRDWTLIPSAMVRYTATGATVDVSGRLRYKQALSFGASWRFFESAAVALVGINLTESLALNYTYDLGTTGLAQFNQGSHEVQIGLRLKKNDRNRRPEARFW